MSEQEFYEYARQRSDRRKRHWIFLGADLLAWFAYLGVLAALTGTISGIGLFVALAWFGLLIFHASALATTQTRDQAVDQAVVLLRRALYVERDEDEVLRPCADKPSGDSV